MIIRSLLKHKLFSVLNLLGLTIGLTCVFIILAWIYNETEYDKFNTNYTDIYQINFKNQKEEMSMAGTPNPLAPVIEDEIANVKLAVRLRNAPGFAFKYKENMYFEENGITADPQLFRMFSFQSLYGDPVKALEQVEGIVITESFAKRYFRNEDPLGKEIQIRGKEFVTIYAVIKDLPSQSHIQFDYVLPQKLLEQYHFCGLLWGDPNFRTYVLLTPGSDPENTGQEITRVAKSNGMPHLQSGEISAYLRPLGSIYLDYSVNNRLGETGDFRYLYIFGSVALLILLLACINFVNLTVSMFAKRQKATSVAKVCGASRKTVFLNSIAENAALIIVSFILAIIVIGVVRAPFQNMIGKPFNEHIFTPRFIGIMALVLFFTLTLCTIYPALVFSRAKAIELMNRYNKQKSGVLKSMVVFQNVIAVLLIVAAIGVNKQMQYINHKKLGFETDQIAYTYLRGNINQKISVVRHSLSENPNITEISLKDCPPFSQVNGTVGISWKQNGEWQNQNTAHPVAMETTRIDDHYLEMMNVEFVAGRNFSNEITADKQNYIVNEEALRLMGLTDPVGAEFSLYGKKGIILGVIKDTYFKSLHQKVNPQVFHLYNNEAEESYFSSLFFRISGDIPATIEFVENIWTENNPGIPFEYHFLNQDYEDLYKKDNQIAGILNFFTLLAVFIACLGLFGQAAISSENKIKEIGIRKVNGAKVAEILTMLNKDFIKWVVIAIGIATPIAWYAMNKWLENFAYKTTLSWWIFALAGVLALGIALLTVSWQSWRAATRNPVESLRYE
ncbi:putative ABC transport system permease protein [Draconibacterium orientale]|nr:putative ABC transport system permease protein [Draconibacterium orientale]